LKLLLAQVFCRKETPPNKLLHLTRVLHDDEHLCVLVKPEGVYTHGYGHSRHRKSLTHIISRLVAPSKEPDALKKPAPAHRLDKKTGGLIVFVKTLSAARRMREQFDGAGSVTKRCDLRWP
jgi:23S rRNA-/tRNA-specific pseudouridylate synthase